MDKSSIQCFLFILLTIIVTFISCSNAQREVEDESEFSYEQNVENGPEKWGKLKPEWKMCGKGEMQSPIDLMNERVRIKLQTLQCLSQNRGHDMMLRFEERPGSIKINGIEYQLLQLHWHSPSEHTINGRSFALELHMVHESINGSMAVVTVLYKIGRSDSFLTLLENKLSAMTDQTRQNREQKYYRYVGSLTTPPCTQNITWTVVKKDRGEKPVRLLRVAVHDDSNTNARPVQPTNKRVVKLYRPRSY
ncbi:hypothetical protein HID58_063724 [Brassica napus]|uniref:Carbonic anhydrase n=1 Tax=Brassica napus TaxID=3708 RepID=A0ABQ7XHF8_BRANA|nr:hypothetical protein HID58_063724 [Brassica napus]